MSSTEIIRTLGAATSLVVVACDSPTRPGKTIVIPPPSIACPAAPALVQTMTMQPVIVAYGSATTMDGTQPLTVSCVPPSGSAFPVGSTPVTCTVTDAVRRSASCSFTVVVTFVPSAPRLSVTRFVAFGDSITRSVVPDGTFPARFRVFQLLPDNLTYPGQLQMMLRSRYATQTTAIVVVNEGQPSETAVGGTSRLPSVLAIRNPDVLLLLEGVNDLNADLGVASIPKPTAALRAMIRSARAQNVRVMVGTLLPQNPTGIYGRTANLVGTFNAQLVPMATAEGAIVVDLNAAFQGHVTDWIGVDGLHPNPAGYQAMAQVFVGAIKTAFETMAPVPARTLSDSAGPVGLSRRTGT